MIVKADGSSIAFLDNMYSATVLMNGQLVPQERRGMRDDAKAVGPVLPGVPSMYITDAFGNVWVEAVQPGFSGRVPAPPGMQPSSSINRRESLSVPFEAPGFSTHDNPMVALHNQSMNRTPVDNSKALLVLAWFMVVLVVGGIVLKVAPWG